MATLKSQLERGRKKLADAITARGYTFGTALLATAAATTTGSSVPKLNDTILAAVAGSPTDTVAALIKGEAVNGMLRKAKYALLALLGLGAVGLGVVAQQPPEPQPPAADAAPAADRPGAAPAEEPVKPAAGVPGRTFAGKVLGADGKPVPGAKIYYCFPDRGTAEIPAVPARATTNPDGRFTFTLGERDVPNTAAAVGNDPLRGGFLVAKAEGRTWAWEQVHADTGDVVLTCAGDTVPVRGRIIDLQGQPIAGVRVTPLGVAAPAKGDFSAFMKAFERGETVGGAVRRHLPNFWHDYSAIQRRPSPLLPAATTDAKGWFQLDGYAAERVVEVRLEGDAIETQDVYFVTGKPGPLPIPKRLTEADDTAGFFRREMAPQREPKVLKANGDSYVAAPGLVVTGVVRDAVSGKPVPAAVVETYRLAGQGRFLQNTIYRTTTDAEGRYRLGGLPLAHGSAIRVRNTGDVPLLPVVKDIPETKLFVPAGLDIALARGVWAEITTTDRATGKPVAGDVSYFVAPENPNGPKGNRSPTETGYDRQVNVPNDGRLRLAVIPDRPAVLAFSAAPGLTPLSRYAMAADAVKRQESLRGASPGWAAQNYNAFADIDPKAGSDPIPVRFTLDSSRRVEGKLIGPDGKPVSGALASGLLHDWYTEPLMPLRGAEFAVLGVGAEHPRLVCFSQSQSKLAGSVVVRGDEKGPLVVKLQPAASVRGRLVDDAGQPVKGARLGVVELPLARAGEYHSTETGVLLRNRIGGPLSNGVTTIKKDGTVATTDLGANAGAMANTWMSTVNPDGSVTTTGRRDPDPATDDDGRFTVAGLVPGLKYHLVWKDARRPRPPASDDWKGIVFRDVVFKPGEDKDVGEVKSQPLPAEKK
ncbi:carboxypeptidase regulatory-like domain-containing protein [Frigoriglobus tundricola]|uniref:carboxypeptidase regulatory-like domain-containing protein n=1 Tax=Frigoriglobus tundricola TaxID=2774151 RepID=UPI00148EC4BE|nr:carboxypeptidase regulatory-like domain-containing protein [Frigoriglobus tundricola]